MSVILEARVWQKTDTYEGWMDNPLLLGQGEMALVVDSTGIPLNMRWGQENPKRFSDLPNAIAYDQGTYVSYSANPGIPVAYTIVGAGTYGSIIIADDELGILGWNGTSWTIDNRVKLPMRSLPIGLLNIGQGFFNINITDRKLLITGIGSVNSGFNRYLFNTPQTIDFPTATTGYYALIFNPVTLNFSIYVQTNLTGVDRNNLYVSTIYLNDVSREVVADSIPFLKINGQYQPTKLSNWSGFKNITGDVLYYDDYFWSANQNTLEDSIPGVSDRFDVLEKFRRADVSSPPSAFNFDLTARKLIISGISSFSYRSKRSTISTAQTIDFPVETGGYYAVLSNNSGALSIVSTNNLSSVSSRLFLLFVFYHANFNNSFSVKGLGDYYINGQPKSILIPQHADRAYRTGEICMTSNFNLYIALDPPPIVGSIPGVSARWRQLFIDYNNKFIGPSNSINFDLINRRIITSGTSAVVVSGSRILVTPNQIVNFPTSTSGYYAVLFNKSNGNLTTSLISQMAGLDVNLLILCTFYYNESNGELVVNGIPDYYINGAPKPTGQATLERKFSFDIGTPYYNATTNLSMSEGDPIVLKDQPIGYLYGLYDSLMEEFPDYITKTQFGEQENTGGTTLPLYYWRFKPSNLIKNTGFGNDERLKVVITSATHGGEKTCAIATWILMDAICKQWRDDEFLEAMRWNCEFVVVACASPYQWQQNTLGLSPGRKNINGVDPNRNYPIGWSGGSSNPSDVDYRGTAPLSEIETQAVASLLSSEYVEGSIALDFHTFVNSPTEPYDISWVITTPKTNPAAQAFARRLARVYKDKLPTTPQGVDVPFVRVNSSVSGGMTYKYYNSLGYKSYLMEINENFQIVPGYVRNDNYALKYGTESFANMLREVIKTNIV